MKGKIEGEWMAEGITRKDIIAMLRISYGNGAKKMRDVILEEMERVKLIHVMIPVESVVQIIRDIEIVDDEETSVSDPAG